MSIDPFSLLKVTCFIDYLKKSIPIIIGGHIMIFFFYKEIVRRLHRNKRPILYAFSHASSITLSLFSWIFLLLTTIFFERFKDGQNIFILDMLNKTALLFWGATFVITLNRFLLKDHLLSQIINHGIVKNISYLFYSAWVAWMIILVIDLFFSKLKTYYNPLYKILVIYTGWCFVIMTAYALYIFVDDYIKKQQKHETLGNALLKAINLPIILLLIGTTIVYTKDFLIDNSNVTHTHYQFVILVCFLYTMFRFISLGEKVFTSAHLSKEAPNRTMVQGMGNFIRILLALVILIASWSFFTNGDISLASLSTILGGTGLGLAFAARPIILNYLSGFVLYFEGHFLLGDWIYFVDNDIEGFIEHIGPSTIAIRTFDKRLLYIPNSLFTTNSVVNASKMTHRRIFKKIPIGWVTDLATLDKIIQEIRLVIYNHAGIDKTQLLMVHFTGFGTTALEITIYAFTNTKNRQTYLNVQENILRETKRIIEQHAGAPPTYLLHNLSEPHKMNFY